VIRSAPPASRPAFANDRTFALTFANDRTFAPTFANDRTFIKGDVAMRGDKGITDFCVSTDQQREARLTADMVCFRIC
jgi:hypothetical protein